MEQMNRGAEMYCLGCLCSGNEYKIQEYNMKYYDHFIAILNVASLKLCYLCRTVAQHAELFIRNVHYNQIILENYFEDCTSSSCIKPESKGPKPITLSFSITVTDSVQDNDSHNNHTSEGSFTHTVANTAGLIHTGLFNTSNNKKELGLSRPEPHSVTSADELTTVSCDEVKQELDINVYSELESDEDYDNDSSIKQENLPLVQSVQENNMQNKPTVPDKSSPKEQEDNKTTTNLKKLTSKKVFKAVKEKNDDNGVDMVRITLKQCMEERRLKALEPSYQARPYKCDDCVKGFAHRAAYEEHRQQWHGAAGGAVCSVCAMRLSSDTSLAGHMRHHTVRYRCRECGLSTPHRAVAVAHVQSTHRTTIHACPHCHKRFRRHISYKRHIQRVHQRTIKLICDLCNKCYTTKAGLRVHMAHHHPAAVGAPPPERSHEREHRCPHCPAAFTVRARLQAHIRTHSDHKTHYCVECDKGYKTDGALTAHLQTAPAHVDKTNMPSCPQCHKRFTSESSRDRHIDAVHLDHRPHKCDSCDKSYSRKSHLRYHVRITHDGYKPPRKHLCSYCQKGFTRRVMLTEHIRSHTGERPIQCADCDDTFTYSSALRAHRRLKHKKKAATDNN